MLCQFFLLYNTVGYGTYSCIIVQIIHVILISSNEELGQT